jgi:hypothetical protein
VLAILLLHSLPLLFTAACASSGAEGPAVRKRQDVLTQEEIAHVEAGNLHEVITRLRPRWLSNRADSRSFAGARIVVYQGMTLMGDVEVLKQVPVSFAESIQYMDGATAMNALPGAKSMGPNITAAIIIRTLEKRP